MLGINRNILSTLLWISLWTSMLFDASFCNQRRRHRHRKQAIDVSGTNLGNIPALISSGIKYKTNNDDSSAGSNNAKPVQWPGSDNSVPFITQWGSWTQQDIQRGSGQRVNQPTGTQLLPGQAQWYPNSPQYSGVQPAGGQQYNQQQQQQQTNNGVNTFPNGQPILFEGDKNWQQQQEARHTAFYWPPTSTVDPNNGSLPSTWNTWSDIKRQGAAGAGGQWQNWYMNPDVWAQWQEWLVLQQRKHAEYPNGPLGAANNQNQTFPDDTPRILVDLLAGFVAGTYPRTIAMYNAKTYYPQYRRDYWIGLRFYALDPQATIQSYITCVFPIPPDIDVLYEIDKERVGDIVFQCVKYQETCCKLNCCDLKGNPLYYASWLGPNSSGRLLCLKILSTGLSLLLVLLITF